MDQRIKIQWTETARNQLANLPSKVRRGILDKANELLACTDPRRVHKPLTGPLSNYYRLTYGRYRAIYSVDENELPSGVCLVYLTVMFVAVGQRKERDRKDIYRIAEKLVEFGILTRAPDNPTD